MNKKILVIALALMFVAMFAAPVLAAPAEKISFTATQTPNPIQPPQGEDLKVWTTEGNTTHVRNLLGAGTIILRIGSQAPISGTTSSIIDVNRISTTGTAHVKFLMTWTFADGSFVGNILSEGPSSTVVTTAHGVLHGTDAYEGLTVLLEGSKAAGQPFQWTGTIVMP